jgi:hypothetical protein
VARDDFRSWYFATRRIIVEIDALGDTADVQSSSASVDPDPDRTCGTGYSFTSSFWPHRVTAK